MGTTKQHFPLLDIGKFLCSLLILFYHYFSEHGGIPQIISEALSSYAIAVALFMTISGFLSFCKIEHVSDRKSRWIIIRNQVWRILRIYLIWSAIYVSYSISRWNFSELQIEYILSQIRHWIFNSTFHTIWFMPSLALGLIAAFWITELLPKRVVLASAGLLYALGALMLTYSSFGNLIPGFASIADFVSTWLGGARGWLFYGIPLVIVGRCMVECKFPVAKIPAIGWLALSIVSVFLMLVEVLTLRHFVGHTGIDMAVMMPISTFFLLGFLIHVHIPIGKHLLWMRKMSVLIFMTQRIFLTVIPHLLPVPAEKLLFSSNYFGFPFVCGGTVLFSAAVIALSQKVKWLRLLY